MLKHCKEVTFEEPDSMDDLIMAMEIKVDGLNIKLVNTCTN